MPEETDASYHEEVKASIIDVESKLNALNTKLDALQADMAIIKPQIQALYEDLNP